VTVDDRVDRSRARHFVGVRPATLCFATLTGFIVGGF
jgi:hypothetical protein